MVQANSFAGTELVSFNNGTSQINDFPINNYYDSWHLPCWPVYYPTYTYVNEKSKIEQAFKIVSKLLEQKIIIKELTIKEFVKLVNDVAEVI